MNGQNEMPGTTEKPAAKRVSVRKRKSFLQRNLLVMILFFLSIISIGVNEYDKKNSEPINIEVDPNLVKEPSVAATQTIKITVYNALSKTLEEKEVSIPRQQNLIEGDFINEIIKNSEYITKNMKFLSAYTLNEGGKNVTIVKLSSDFLGLKANEELYNGFSQAVINTVIKNFPNIHGVTIQIDGETAIIQ